MEHYNNHVEEFSIKGMGPAEYQERADMFLGAPKPQGVLECVRRGGDKVRFNPDTDGFGILTKAGLIRTISNSVGNVRARGIKVYTCPVCGFAELLRPPNNHAICPSCGTEFDYHDCTVSHAALRRRWISSGAEWHSRATPPPPGWKPLEQMSRAGFESLDVPRAESYVPKAKVPRNRNARHLGEKVS